LPIVEAKRDDTGATTLYFDNETPTTIDVTIAPLSTNNDKNDNNENNNDDQEAEVLRASLGPFDDSTTRRATVALPWRDATHLRCTFSCCTPPLTVDIKLNNN
jgi:hypothetical protein